MSIRVIVWKVSEEDYQRHQEKKNSARDSNNQDELECYQTDKTVLNTWRRSCSVYGEKTQLSVIFGANVQMIRILIYMII